MTIAATNSVLRLSREQLDANATRHTPDWVWHALEEAMYALLPVVTYKLYDMDTNCDDYEITCPDRRVRLLVPAGKYTKLKRDICDRLYGREIREQHLRQGRVCEVPRYSQSQAATGRLCALHALAHDDDVDGALAFLLYRDIAGQRAWQSSNRSRREWSVIEHQQVCRRYTWNAAQPGRGPLTLHDDGFYAWVCAARLLLPHFQDDMGEVDQARTRGEFGLGGVAHLLANKVAFDHSPTPPPD